MEAGEKDRLGGIAGEKYSLVLYDPVFERRLKQFDPNLRLRFNRFNERWYVLEKALIGSGYNIILKCEDDKGNPKPVGEWLFNKLFVMRHNYDELRRNPNQWWNNFEYQVEKEQEEIAQKGHVEQKARLIDDVNQWRKAYRDFVDLPKSDVTAGYPKVQFKKEKKDGELHRPDVQRLA